MRHEMNGEEMLVGMVVLAEGEEDNGYDGLMERWEGWELDVRWKQWE